MKNVNILMLTSDILNENRSLIHANIMRFLFECGNQLLSTFHYKIVVQIKYYKAWHNYF